MARQQVFYGWIVVAAATLGIASSFSILVLSMTGIFKAPLQAELGWSDAQIFLGSTVAGLGGIVSAPLVGALADRFGGRRIVLVSFVIEVLVFGSFKFMGPDISGYLLRYGALVLLCMGTTQVVFTRIVSSWFSRHLGMALGVALAGVGFGGGFWSLTLQKLIDLYGWRNAYLGVALIVACVTLPLLFILLRDTPASMGLAVDGSTDPVAQDKTRNAIRSGMSLPQAAATGQYWLMVWVFLLMGSALQAVQLHLVSLLTSRGASPQWAAQVQASMLFAVIFGRLSSGYLLDHIFAPRVAQLFLLAPIVGISALTLGVSGGWAFASAMCIGLAVGGESDVIAYLVRRYFGLKHYSRIYGTFFSAFGVGTAIGPEATAWALKRAGGPEVELAARYGAVLWAHVGVLVLVIVLLFFFKPYTRER
jgi:MFS family permease